MEDARNKIRDLALGNLSPEDSLRLLDMIERVPELSSELELATSLINFSAEEGKDLFTEHIPTRNQQSGRTSAFFHRLSALYPSRGLRYIGYGLAAFFVIASGLSLLSTITTSPYVALSSLGEPRDMDRLRASGQQELVRAYERSNSADHEETIRLLERYARHHPRDEMIGFVRLALGEHYLRSSLTSTLTLFPSFDPSKVERALHQLDQVIASGGNDRLVEEAYWLRAKGALMLERPDSAMSDLRNLLRIRGRLSPQAEQLSREIARITSPE